MKVVGINGSPRKDGNTYHALTLVGKELEAAGIEFEILHVGNKKIKGCFGCGKCIEHRDRTCFIKDDANEFISKMDDADGFILGSPTYFSGVAGTMKCFLDRAFYVATVNKSMFRNKVAAAIATVRRSGGVTTFNQLNHYLTYGETIMATSNYWNVIHGNAPGEVLEDPEGVQIMKVLGKNMAMLLQQVERTKDVQEENPFVRKTYTNFIR